MPFTSKRAPGAHSPGSIVNSLRFYGDAGALLKIHGARSEVQVPLMQARSVEFAESHSILPLTEQAPKVVELLADRHEAPYQTRSEFAPSATY